MTDNYVLILRESLEKKVEILEHIQAENRKQRQVLEDNNSDVDEFEATLDYKASLVDQIVKLDDGFETLFARVEEELQAKIQRMQELIRQITDLSTAVQAQEKENEKLAREKFAYVRKQVQKVRKSQKAVNNYYQSMRGDSVYQPQFMDKSK